MSIFAHSYEVAKVEYVTIGNLSNSHLKQTRGSISPESPLTVGCYYVSLRYEQKLRVFIFWLQLHVQPVYVLANASGKQSLKTLPCC